jgi:peroxiredoxin Q/BCP
MRQFDVAYFAASTDDEETNRKFAKSLDLDYPILSDPGRTAARAFGVLRTEYAARNTFYIGKDGTILFVDRDVKPATAGEDIARRLAELKIPRREKASRD